MVQEPDNIFRVALSNTRLLIFVEKICLGAIRKNEMLLNKGEYVDFF